MTEAGGNKTCVSCGKALHGRADKKFCNDYCRNAFNNGLKSVSSNAVRNINNTLLKNRRILEATLGRGEMQKVPKEKLLQQGFQFRFQTHTYTNKKGNVYTFCYEYGYLPLDGNWLLVVRRNEAKAT